MKVETSASSSSSDSTVVSVACRALVEGEEDWVNGTVAEPIGESGLVDGLSETVAFGREDDGSRGPVGVADLIAIVGAPTRGFVEVGLVVGVPVGVRGLVIAPALEARGIVGAPVGTAGLVVAAFGLGESGMVGAPVGMRGLVAACGLDERGIVGAPVGTGGLATAGEVGVRGEVPPGPAVLRGMVGAGVGALPI